jgi:hypothetical protein
MDPDWSLDPILADRPLPQQAVDFALRFDEIKRLELSGNVINSYFHGSSPKSEGQF